MSILQYHGRPWVTFDPSNKSHRRWYNEFVKHGTWGRCPYRFMIPADHGNLVAMIQDSLVKFYVENEFRARKKS